MSKTTVSPNGKIETTIYPNGRMLIKAKSTYVGLPSNPLPPTPAQQMRSALGLDSFASMRDAGYKPSVTKKISKKIY